MNYFLQRWAAVDCEGLSQDEILHKAIGFLEGYISASYATAEQRKEILTPVKLTDEGRERLIYFMLQCKTNPNETNSKSDADQQHVSESGNGIRPSTPEDSEAGT